MIMLSLKHYQENTLKHLKNYCNLCNKMEADEAFLQYTNRQYIGIRQLPGLPYICLKVPTGGGKTILACHSIGTVRKEYLRTDNCTVLWIVPTNAIKKQTLDALRNINHPYRMAINADQEGQVQVFDLQEAMFAGKAEYDNSTCIIVTTLAALRIEDINGRKIYDSNGYLMDHFTGINDIVKNNLEKGDKGEILYSLANVLRMRRPIVIMDEAHNARTELSFDSLKRFSPSAIIEFTATPQQKHEPDKGYYASNVLHSVSAAELKAEYMIKMPIYLETNSNWQHILNKAISKRSELESIATEEKSISNEYIRPILLIQAQAKSQVKETLTVDIIKKSLINDFKIPEDYIKIATGDIKEIEGINLLEENCSVRYIITVQALKEGWDCPFAYVLCSVSDISSSTAAEQLTGRILRLPNAKEKSNQQLNCAYAYVVSSQFQMTLSTLGKGLIENGFSEYDAETFIKKEDNQTTLFDKILKHKEKVNMIPNLNILNEGLAKKVNFIEDTKEIEIDGYMSKEEKEEIKKCFSSEDDKKVIDKIYEDIINTFLCKENIEKFGVDKKIEPFKIPCLSYKYGEQLEVFEEMHFANYEWDILKYNSKIDPNDFITSLDKDKVGKIEIDSKGNVEYRFVESLHEQLSFLATNKEWTEEELIFWLDRNIPHQDISQAKFVMFVHKIINDLINAQGIELKKIVYSKFNLRDKIATLINEYRKKSKQEAYNQILLNSEYLVVKDSNSFTFDPDNYPANWVYKGHHKFNKHYYKEIGELKDSGEEFNCACYIDALPEIKYWVRNLAIQPQYSFWLQTSTDKFYPDFVAMLNDGRILVVEYKGEVWSEIKDSDEKNILGKVWAEKSNGKCLFIMATKNTLSDIDKLIKR